MNQREMALLESGQRVGLALQDFQAEVADFAPLEEANTARGELVTAIEAKAAAQETETESETLNKDQLREQMARATDTLSNRAVAYALATGDLGLQRALRLSYTDVRYGDAAEDVNHVRELVARVQALPAEVRQRYRLTAALLQAPSDAADAFEAAGEQQTQAKSGTRLATLALPELLTKLRTQLAVMEKLVAGMRTDPDPRWEELYLAFEEANKRRGVPASRRLAAADAARPRVVRRLLLHRQDGQAVQLASTNYGPAYTLTVENLSGSDLRLWMAQKDGAETTPQTCPAGQVTTLTRDTLGPETARFLRAQFASAAGGKARITVRRVV